ncbi:IS66 family insertion sequence element accessory protein TnpA, partial [Parendozoicomonas callyspongiae]
MTAFHKPFSRRTPEQWQQIINDQQASGLPQKVYCRQHGLSLATFCNWK